ncbi:uncharacterized protein G2W53_000431 [Senna tora]|uniref:Uncharacterized protein n=1 Tax=Senna tora TaxID=362788 RepID=A0A835CJG3_9FABA|nr:uncharacterized protein G2W53_000431 [Senna tora]
MEHKRFENENGAAISRHSRETDVGFSIEWMLNFAHEKANVV